MIPFKTQFDKLTRAYINNEVNPNHNCACFVGNLLNQNKAWGNIRRVGLDEDFMLVPNLQAWSDAYTYGVACINKESDNTYTAKEIVALEQVFLDTLYQIIPIAVRKRANQSFNPAASLVHLNECPLYEDALFTAFQATLDKLREIHISKGENVDEFIFTKRKLEVV